MNLKLNITIFLATLLLVANTNAGVVRIDAVDTKILVQKAASEEATPATTTTQKTTVLTAEPKPKETKPDADATTDATLGSIPTAEPPRAVTRDADATIEIDAAPQDPVAAEGVDLTVDLEVLQAAGTKNVTDLEKKSAALLLLSVPNHEKPKQLEENIEDPEELAAEASTQETTTTESATDITTTTDWEAVMESTTPLVIKTNDTVCLEESEKECDDKTVAVDAVQESSPVAPSDNARATLLIAESGDDFLIFDSDVEQLGSFTHVDSEEYLQPIVQSVEIVPTSLDDPLIVNYVHNW